MKDQIIPKKKKTLFHNLMYKISNYQDSYQEKISSKTATVG